MKIDVESWQAIAGAVALLVVAVAGRWDQRKTRKVAQQAVDQTVATGNGFAKTVTTALVRIEEQGVRTEKKIDDHIATHAQAAMLGRPRKVAHDIPDL